MNIRSPESTPEWTAYFHARWEWLRKPWAQPEGSEKDPFENDAFHLMAANACTEVIGVGRLHRRDAIVAQVRFMAVRPDCAGRGIGRAILALLEAHATSLGVGRVELNARESAVRFYTRNGYLDVREGPTLWGAIRHRVMQKSLSS